MRDYLDIGSSPIEEDCVQTNPDDADYVRKQKIECKAYIEALKKKLGEPPDGAELRIKGNPHDFGTYYEVVCYYDDENEEAQDYAFRCEGEGPLTWAEVGMSPPNFD